MNTDKSRSCFAAALVVAFVIFELSTQDVLRVSAAVAQTTPAAAADEQAAELPKNGPPMEAAPEGELVAVIPAGQDELLADMLGKGATLVGGCTLADGQASASAVRATYTCSTGQVVFDLVHPDQGSRGETHTERFAIVLRSGAAPDGFAADLASRIRAREAAFEWKRLGTPAKPSAFQRTTVIAAACLVGVALLLWALFARVKTARP